MPPYAVCSSSCNSVVTASQQQLQGSHQLRHCQHGLKQRRQRCIKLNNIMQPNW
jgi:hypothetical protein